MPTTTYAHWRWPNFSPAEIACRGTGAIKINSEAMGKLQSLRNRLDKPLIVPSESYALLNMSGSRKARLSSFLLLLIAAPMRRGGSASVNKHRRVIMSPDQRLTRFW